MLTIQYKKIIPKLKKGIVIKIIRSNGIKTGPGNARKCGIAEAKGDFVGFPELFALFNFRRGGFLWIDILGGHGRVAHDRDLVVGVLVGLEPCGAVGCPILPAQLDSQEDQDGQQGHQADQGNENKPDLQGGWTHAGVTHGRWQVGPRPLAGSARTGSVKEVKLGAL